VNIHELALALEYVAARAFSAPGVPPRSPRRPPPARQQMGSVQLIMSSKGFKGQI